MMPGVINKREVLRESRMFRGLSEKQLDTVLSLCREEFYEVGSQIHSAGEKAENLYVVAEGRVRLEMDMRIGARSRKQVTVDVISKGEIFGWPALTDEPVHKMTAVATENTRLLAIEGALLLYHCDRDIELYRKVTNEIINVVSDRLASAKQTLAHVLSVASHDLRAPLATVQSCLDAILGGFAGEIDGRQRELMAGSRQRIVDLTHMVDNILDLSYIDISKGDFEEISLLQLVEKSIADVKGMAQQRNIRIVNDVPASSPPVLGIPARLLQVLNNLLSNAVKFTPSGGTVSINTEETKNYVLVKVCDTGIGISQEDLPKIFDDFYRGLRVDAEGAGLGLGIAKRIVEAHRGMIYVESPCPDTGVGTRFTFTLPKVVPGDNGHEKEAKRPTYGAKIVVADDDPHMLRVTTLFLESQGYRVYGVRDGVEALAKVDEVDPDLLILDLLMPRMDGFEVCKRHEERVAQGSKKVPIIILSAVREDSSRRRYELETKTAFKVDGYLVKPIAPPVLIQTVEKILQQTKGVNGAKDNKQP
jgi:signal transduction histidine kinase/FixJ family two-component response regulator